MPHVLGLYILDGKTPVRLTDADVLVWAEWMQTANHRVALTSIDPWTVSTVFLGVDYNFFGGTPRLFETMIFGPEPLAGAITRYGTWDEAEHGHQTIVALVREHAASLPPQPTP